MTAIVEETELLGGGRDLRSIADEVEEVSLSKMQDEGRARKALSAGKRAQGSASRLTPAMATSLEQ